MTKQDLALYLSAVGLLATLHVSIAIIIWTLLWLLVRSARDG